MDRLKYLSQKYKAMVENDFGRCGECGDYQRDGAIYELLAALNESRKENEKLRDNARRAKTILQEEIESIEQEDGGRGCVTAMIDAIVELEGKQ